MDSIYDRTKIDGLHRGPEPTSFKEREEIVSFLNQLIGLQNTLIEEADLLRKYVLRRSTETSELKISKSPGCALPVPVVPHLRKDGIK
jgi:hypothetical protein